MINSVVLDGRLTKDPKTQQTRNGENVTSFTLAVDRYSKDDKKQADFISVVCFGNIAATCAKYLRKGSRAVINGSIRVSTYDDRNGQKHWRTDVFANQVDFVREAPKQNKPTQNTQQNNGAMGNFGGQTFDEDIPF